MAEISGTMAAAMFGSCETVEDEKCDDPDCEGCGDNKMGA